MAEVNDKAFDITPVREEYEQCLKFFVDPSQAPPLYGIGGFEEVRVYFGARAEGLGFALDAFERHERAVAFERQARAKGSVDS